MKYNSIMTMLDGIECGICSNGSYIKLRNIHEDEKKTAVRLYSHMKPKDVLCCEAALVSDKNVEYPFSLEGLCPYSYALACFTTIMSMRFFSVLFFESPEEYLRFEKETEYRKNITPEEMAVAIATVNGPLADNEENPPDRDSVSVLRTVTKVALRNVLHLERFNGATAFEIEDDRDNMYLMPVNISMPAFVRIITELLLCVLTLSSDKRLTLSYDSDVRRSAVRIETEMELLEDIACAWAEIGKAFPQADSLIDALCYTARMYDAVISVSRAGGKKFAVDLSFVGNEEREVDFKSRDILAGFDEAFDITLRYSLLCLSSDAEQ